MSDVTAGQMLAGYRLIELAGEGGMGRVYRAVQPGIDRVVGLKVIRRDLASDPAFQERFKAESRLAASIDHPNVIPVYEADEADGALFVAMRWVEGSDLQRLLAVGGPLDPARAVDLLRQLADGLDAAHAEGLIHRDIKPGNVLLEREHVFLSDFGLARTAHGSDQTTQIGGLVGTVDYLAPELVEGGTATIASDVYALGCVLFQMLTGSVPYPVDGLIGKLHAHSQGDLPLPSELRPGLPRGFDGVLERALAKDPDRRYASAGELAEAAERALRTAPRRPPREPVSRRMAALLAAGGALAIAIVVALVLVLTGGGSDSGGAPPAARTLPEAASLKPCGDLLTGPSRDCRNVADGVDVVTREGAMARMGTMDFKVDRVIQSHAIREPYSGDTVTAPAGHRFIVVECSIANRLRRAQPFEPDQGDGRQTELFLFDRAGNGIASDGPHFADRTEQNLPATSAIPLSLIGKTFQPHLRGEPPFSGVLVFSYPISALRSARSMLLLVHEFGQGLSDERSLGAFPLDLGHSQIRALYKAAAI